MKFLEGDGPFPSNEPQQIGDVIKELGGVEGVVGADLPAGRTEKDQRLASLNAEVKDIGATREDLIGTIQEGNQSHEIKEELQKITQTLLEAQAERNKVKQVKQ